jgi:hypothetical protein
MGASYSGTSRTRWGRKRGRGRGWFVREKSDRVPIRDPQRFDSLRLIKWSHDSQRKWIRLSLFTEFVWLSISVSVSITIAVTVCCHWIVNSDHEWCRLSSRPSSSISDIWRHFSFMDLLQSRISWHKL